MSLPNDSGYTFDNIKQNLTATVHYSLLPAKKVCPSKTCLNKRYIKRIHPPILTLIIYAGEHRVHDKFLV